MAEEVADTSSVCEWNADNYGLNLQHPGAQAYYYSQLRQFAAWGVDFVKADDMLGPYFAAEIDAYRQAISRSGRDMVLSLSPGRADRHRRPAAPECCGGKTAGPLQGSHVGR